MTNEGFMTTKNKKIKKDNISQGSCPKYTYFLIQCTCTLYHFYRKPDRNEEIQLCIYSYKYFSLSNLSYKQAISLISIPCILTSSYINKSLFNELLEHNKLVQSHIRGIFSEITMVGDDMSFHLHCGSRYGSNGINNLYGVHHLCQ